MGKEGLDSHTRFVCPSCGSTQVEQIGPLAPGHIFAGRPLDKPLPGGVLYRCTTCALVFRYPLPSKEKLDALYRQGSMEMWQYESGKRPDWVLTKRWLVDHYSGGSVLDVGCYDGAFLEALGDGWAGYGIEIHKEAARRAQERGVKIVGTDAAMLPALEQQFDVVVAFDLIEHMPDPRRLLAEMADRVTSGGFVVIGSGNAEALSWRLMGSHYWYCTIPEHLAFISASWCREAAEVLGLELVYTARYSHAASRRMWARISEAGKNMLYHYFPGLFRKLRASGFGGIEVAANPELTSVPPVWITAQDHILAIFQKQ